MSCCLPSPQFYTWCLVANNMPHPHGRRTRSPYSFSLDELKVLRDAKKKLIGATKKERATLVANGIRDVISVARQLHPNLTPTRETAIRIAVVKWIRKNSATRTRSQKVGTKQWNPRRVFFELNRFVSKRPLLLLPVGELTMAQSGHAFSGQGIGFGPKETRILMFADGHY